MWKVSPKRGRNSLSHLQAQPLFQLRHKLPPLSPSSCPSPSSYVGGSCPWVVPNCNELTISALRSCQSLEACLVCFEDL